MEPVLTTLPEESRSEGKIGFNIYKKYFAAGANYFVILILLFLSVLAQVSHLASWIKALLRYAFTGFQYIRLPTFFAQFSNVFLPPSFELKSVDDKPAGSLLGPANFIGSQFKQIQINMA